MLKGQDILVLLKLALDDRAWTVRALADELDLDVASVHRALGRLEEARLVGSEHSDVNRAQAEEFLVHGLKYVFPARLSGLTRGVPTAWAASPLREELAPSDDPALVWPHPRGEVRGIALEPLHGKVPGLARKDPALAEALALLDGIRLGDARVRGLAVKHLGDRLRGRSRGAS